MPVSKRNKVVSLTKVKKTTRGAKDELIEEIRGACGAFKRVYVLSFQNQRNSCIKVIRENLRPGRLFYGKGKVAQVALGDSPETEVLENIRILSRRCKGERGLLFSDDPPEKVKSLCRETRPQEFAIAGTIADQTVTLEEGVGSLSSLPSSMESTLRKLGLPTQLSHGQIVLLGKHVVCTAGEPLSAHQAQVLKLLGLKMAGLRVVVEACWEDGKVREYIPFEASKKDGDL